MKIDYKNFNVKDLGRLFIMGLLLLVVTAIVTTVVTPIITTVFPTVFVAKLTLTETFLFLILLTLVVRH